MGFIIIFILIISLMALSYILHYYFNFEKATMVVVCICIIFFVVSFLLEIFLITTKTEHKIVKDNISISYVYKDNNNYVCKITYVDNASNKITVNENGKNDILINSDIQDNIKSATQLEIIEESYFSIFYLCDMTLNTTYIFS